METVVALTIAAVALSFFVAAFAPATLGIRKANSVQDAKNLASAVEAELNTFRSEAQDSDYSSAFEKAFDWVSMSQSDEDFLVAFTYRAQSTGTYVDGILPGYQGKFTAESDAQPMILQTRFTFRGYAVGESTPFSSTNPHESDVLPIDAIEGPIFAVKLTQLSRDTTSGGLKVVDAPTSQLYDSDGVLQDYANFLEPVILLKADFYLLKSNSRNYLKNFSVAEDLPDRPVYTKYFGVSR